MGRLLEPPVELDLYDDEHVLVRVFDPRRRDGEPELELVLEDAAWRELSRRRVTLRYQEELEAIVRDGGA